MKLYRREKYLSKIRPFVRIGELIKVVTGVRRCGKSCLMQTIADELLEAGVPEENIIFINLEKRGYRSLRTPDQLESVILEKTHGTGLHYLFIDEVQNVKGFERLINGFRAEGGYSIFITGSNSYLLSGELMTVLTGRYIELEMFPLSFDEYLGMKAYYGKETSKNRLEELNKYIIEGGFPFTVHLDSREEKRTYVQNLTKEIFEKDVRRRVKITNRALFEAVRDFVINNFGASFSLNSLQRALGTAGYPVSYTTLSRYIEVLMDAKIIYSCRRFDLRSKKALMGEQKYYLADLSLYYSLNTDNRVNYGPSLENIVFVYAKSMGYSVSVGRIGNFECDFILRGGDMDYFYVQVATTVIESRETEDREYRPLEAVHDNYPKYVMTLDYLMQRRNGIKHVNLAEFMAAGEKF